MRTTAALITSAGLLLGLTACSTPGSTVEPTCDVTSGNASEAIAATGAAGDSLDDLSFPTPLVASSTQVSILEDGAGESVSMLTPMFANFAVYNGRTGEVIQPYGPIGVDQSTGEPQLITLQALTGIAGFQEAMQCATEGSRVAVAVPPEDAFGETGSSQLGVGADDTLVFVADVIETFPSRATGDPRPARAGFPSVVTDHDGVPGITIPPSAAPDEYRETLLREGDGVEVSEGDTVMVHYTGVLWDSGEVFDSSWTRGTPVSFPAQEGSAEQQGVVKGFADALIGAQVGDQVLAVLPPDVAYGDEASGSIPAGSTLVFVIDVLGVTD
ncbi:FKBP-type peptidyl-prolyl cis-trans isomerase [Planctomonas psychrotolerans]|uniref:FKBP-type peptidyl-prolyl cis-trans isomerase n=1 Tax=Planctomonas psychrotolerans TaxID=2528712 RepID=UPI00123B1BE8|nr:FKBP-type peptidyl-prolyl cis-trans isomerase [Planctomonas psychrotolerans]